MKLEDLIFRLQVEEESRNAEKKNEVTSENSKVHMVEEGTNSQGKRKHNDFSKKKNKGKKRKFDGDCYNCGKPGHLARDCRTKNGKENQKKKNKSEASFVEDVPELNLVALISDGLQNLNIGSCSMESHK
ncbi:hypothetical protein MKW92_049423 [Papaver armeniacum]|nr:hypothetical protein MKW92_049423 [Papaver armeniacum]